MHQIDPESKSITPDEDSLYAFQKADAFCEKEAIRSKQRFDRTARCSKLLP